MKFEIMFGLMGLMLFAGCIVEPDVDEKVTVTNDIPKFTSCSAIADEFENSMDYGGYWGMEEALGTPMMAMDAESGGSRQNSKSTSDYSETNVQVAGVDEADIVKTDGKYIYVVSNNQFSKYHYLLILCNSTYTPTQG